MQGLLQQIHHLLEGRHLLHMLEGRHLLYLLEGRHLPYLLEGRHLLHMLTINRYIARNHTGKEMAAGLW